VSYALIEAGVQDLLQALSRYADADVRRGDFGVLDSGVPRCVVLIPGPFEAWESGDWAQKHYRWTVYAELYHAYQDQGSSEVALDVDRQDVLDTLHANPTVGGVDGVTRCVVERGDPLQYIYDTGGGGPHWVMQRLTVIVDEERNYAGGGEFA